MDNGKISTILITLAAAILGVFVADPSLLSNLIGQANYTQYGALIIALIIAIYNLAYPRSNTEIPEDSA